MSHVISSAVPNCGACPGDGSICRAECRHVAENPLSGATPEELAEQSKNRLHRDIEALLNDHGFRRVKDALPEFFSATEAPTLLPVSAGLPPPDEHDRVLIYTEGVDFNGDQYFEVNTEDLWEPDPDMRTEVADAATHWMPLPRPGIAPATQKAGAAPDGATLTCMYCGGSEGHSERVHTGDLESKGGWEDWFCCHRCRDAGEPCETFHPIPKDCASSATTPASAQPVAAAPADFVLVPRKITPEMIEAAMESHYGKRRVAQVGGAGGIAMTVNNVDWSGIQAMRRFWKGALSAAPAAPVAQAFPERDTSRPAEQQGMFRKFDVRRVDGSDQPGGKHYGCRYYVLDLTHDQHAPAAMRAYASTCLATHPLLAADIVAEFGAPVAQSTTASASIEDRRAYDEACNLAKSIYSQHYREDAAEWRVLPDLRGVISQISNMVSGMTRTDRVYRLTAPSQESAPLDLIDAINTSGRTVDGSLIIDFDTEIALRAALTQQGAAQVADDRPTWGDVQAREHDIRSLQSRVIELEAAQVAHGGADAERDAARYRWIEENCRTKGGGHGFTIFVPVDHEDIGSGIDVALLKLT